MDTSDSEIVFDANGHCNHCTDFLEYGKKHVAKEKEAADYAQQMIKRIKEEGKGKKYDCLLGISGGVDSCYAAYILQKAGLRVLTMHMDNGWDSDVSVRNIKNVVDKLGLDYESYVLDWETFKDLQLSFLKASVPEMETPTDIAISAALHKVAAKNNIKYIISGGNLQTEGILPRNWHYDAKDMKYLKAVHKQFGTASLKNFPMFGYREEIYYKMYHRIRTIYLLNYLPYSKKDAMNFLQDNLGWQYYGGKHHESMYTKFVQSYILPEKFDIDYRKATFSTQICTGEKTREEALEKMKTLPYDAAGIEEEKKYVIRKLNISNEDFDAIMADTPKTHEDYPNNKKWLEFLYRMYKKLYPKKF